MPDLIDRPVHERYDHLLRVIGSQRFLNMQGLGNEIPFFICPFHPEDALEMNQLCDQMVNQLGNRGITVLKINLYDLTIELLKARGIWNRILEQESSLSKGELKELLQSVLDPEAHLIPAIAEKMAEREFDVLFITGVGEVFPYIRSHSVLNNLQSTATTRPTVMFFPGLYTQSLERGSSLNLFGRLHDDNYYRAFNIYRYHL